MRRSTIAPRVALVLAGMSAVAWTLAALVAGMDISKPLPRLKNVFYRLYGLHERPLFALLAVFLIGTVFYLRREAEPRGSGRDGGSRLAVLIIAAFVTGVTWLGFRSVMRSFPLSMDEFNAVFQSRIFAAGHIAAVVPSPWSGAPALLTPGFVAYNPGDHEWASTYLPGYAALRAVALRLSLATVLNPLLAGVSILLLAAITRKLWPKQARAPLAAAALLASSSQFLATSMTTYSMPAHLFVNLLWLLLYLRSEGKEVAWELFLLPWLGVLALGMHNPFPHALFAAPFLIRMARSRSKGTAAYVGVVYLLGCIAWLGWWRLTLPASVQGNAIALFRTPDVAQILTQVMSVSLIMSWQTPVLVLGACVAFVAADKMAPVEKDLLWGIIATLGFYVLFRTSQGHGWGYRYAYGVLGNLVLLGVTGVAGMCNVYGYRPVLRLVAGSLLVTLAVQLPLRAVQVGGFVRPFAAASRMIASSDASVVVVPTHLVWYGSDLVRNGPFLSEPVTVAMSRRDSAGQRQWLQEHFPGRVRYLRPVELQAVGLSIIRPGR